MKRTSQGAPSPRKAPLGFVLALAWVAAHCGNGPSSGSGETPAVGARTQAVRGGVEVQIVETNGVDGNKAPSGTTCVSLKETYGGRLFPGIFARLCFNVDLGWQWSESGPIGGKTCVRFNEPKDSAYWHWDDNYLCYDSSRSGVAQDLIFRWSHDGPLVDMGCVQVPCGHCGPERVWQDNYLCLATDPGKFVHRELGGDAGRLGAAMASGHSVPAADGVGRVQHFEKGKVYWHPELGTFDLPKATWKLSLIHI